MTPEADRTDQKAETEDSFQQFSMRDYIPEEDREKLLELYDKLRRNSKGRETIRFYFGDLITRSAFKVKLTDPAAGHRTIVLSPEGEIIGWGKYSVDLKDPSRAMFARLIVPEYQGKGIGTALIGRLIERCLQLDPNVTVMESQTLPGNKAAIGSLTKAVAQFGGFKVQEPDMSNVHFTFPLK
jgi:RimJ/RimL family protein N-acetyltransferase